MSLHQESLIDLKSRDLEYEKIIFHIEEALSYAGICSKKLVKALNDMYLTKKPLPTAKQIRKLIAPLQSKHLLPFSAEPKSLSALPKESSDHLLFGLSNTRGFCDAAKQNFYLKTSAKLNLDILYTTLWGQSLGIFSRFTDKVGLIVFNEKVTEYAPPVKDLGGRRLTEFHKEAARLADFRYKVLGSDDNATTDDILDRINMKVAQPLTTKVFLESMAAQNLVIWSSQVVRHLQIIPIMSTLNQAA
ncbi:hypothetical protein DSO57_1038647 [Entomophthora muscae]|uniref:Uncharacterized protein n=1 Tax=Entomophthora muscae TaxID=34485 RepID=A0ACC2UJA1_9FUNG|nr:hypothetical protein DSO57_1038647 [Entomophthora muscae]